MAILPKAIYRFNAIPIKILTQFFTDCERAFLNYIWKNKKRRRATTILYNKRTSECIIILAFNLYYRTIVIKLHGTDIKQTGCSVELNGRLRSKSIHLRTLDF